MIAVLLVTGLVLFFALDLDRYLSLSTIKSSHATLQHLYRRDPLSFIGVFMLVHVSALALCIPGAVLSMALAGGAIFGPALGTLIVLSSLTIGDSLGFLAARYLIGDWVRRRFRTHLRRVDREMRTNGALYLLSMRLVAGIPYFIVNLTFGVTAMRLRTFAPVSFIGLAPATALYVNAGTELSRIESASAVLSPGLIVSLALIGALPIVVRLMVAAGRRRRPAPADAPAD